MIEIVQDFIPIGRNNRPGYWLDWEYITVHDTANPAGGADAIMHARYLKDNEAASRPASWHFTVDDRRAVQHLPLNENGWHAGDGNGPGNRKSIGIEICENAGGDRAKAEDNAARLVAKLLIEKGKPISIVVQHNNWSGKNCPHIIRSRPNGWTGFIAKVQGYMKGAQPEMKKADADKIIKLLQVHYGCGLITNEADLKEIGRLADEVRIASGQAPQNK